MSHMARYVTSLLTYDRNLMKEAIGHVHERRGGIGILENVTTVEGYDTAAKADLVFQFEGMKHPMGIRQTKEHVEFIGDPFGSSVWTEIRNEVLDTYGALNDAIVLSELGFETEAAVTEVGIVTRGFSE